MFALDDAFNKSFIMSAYSFKVAMEDSWRGRHTVQESLCINVEDMSLTSWIVEIVDHMMGIEHSIHLGGGTIYHNVPPAPTDD